MRCRVLSFLDAAQLPNILEGIDLVHAKRTILWLPRTCASAAIAGVTIMIAAWSRKAASP
jgi:hypothetical protein